MLSLVEKKLYEYCNELDLPIQKLSILLSFSGGVDSTVLATLLVELRDKYGFELTLIHFNHNAHKKEQKMDRFCKSFAQKNWKKAAAFGVGAYVGYKFSSGVMRKYLVHTHKSYNFSSYN